MQRRRLGGLEVSAVGLGCATMTPFYDEPDRAAAVQTLHRAREIGIDFLDTSDAYGQGRNEELIARAIKGHRPAVLSSWQVFPGRTRGRIPQFNESTLVRVCRWCPIHNTAWLRQRGAEVTWP
jgi:aryl-alcohol dehydrogenase-like predicted oxidoreductase